MQKGQRDVPAVLAALLQQLLLLAGQRLQVLLCHSQVHSSILQQTPYSLGLSPPNQQLSGLLQQLQQLLQLVSAAMLQHCCIGNRSQPIPVHLGQCSCIW
jgi:hypothetical protein